ncbi:hypothetical protein NM688_g8515 [Phlebia brevispora]|uniref:Uncharacterized protein n=1 Tax=Phlebia brevispora TaxID=194682 RepID=A0ACC1RRS7_9APHY|nr:hypothetical protein NM688_g8515 [Phlebia brevispora]
MEESQVKVPGVGDGQSVWWTRGSQIRSDCDVATSAEALKLFYCPEEGVPEPQGWQLPPASCFLAGPEVDPTFFSEYGAATRLLSHPDASSLVRLGGVHIAHAPSKHALVMSGTIHSSPSYTAAGPLLAVKGVVVDTRTAWCTLQITILSSYLTATLNWFFLEAFAQGNGTDVVVSVPIIAPSDSQPLVPTLLSFSIEQDRWPDWSGIESRNEFTIRALETLAELTGQPPKIRVGANSEDRTTWSPTVTINEDEFPPPTTVTPYPEATQITVGDGYYELSKWMPFGTHMTWGINLGANNATNAVNMVTSIVKAFRSTAVQLSGVILDLIEIGNEPDLYANNGLRTGEWTVEDYVADWISIATPVAEAAGLVKGGPVSLQGASFAGQGFTPTEIFDLGILNSAPGELITVISQHRYSAAFCNGGDFPLVSFMNKANVRSNLTLFENDIAATKEQGLGYILGSVVIFPSCEPSVDHLCTERQVVSRVTARRV